MEARPGARPSSPEEACEICPQGLLVFTGSSEEDARLAKQFWLQVSMYPPCESQLVLSRGGGQRVPLSQSSRSSAPGEWLSDYFCLHLRKLGDTRLLPSKKLPNIILFFFPVDIAILSSFQAYNRVIRHFHNLGRDLLISPVPI